MLSYLTAEAGFIRAFGNRGILLIVLCALTRSGDAAGKASVPGVSIDINPALVTVIGPVLAFLLLVALKFEADALLLSREAVLEEATKLPRKNVSAWIYFLFSVPTLAAAFFTLQFVLKVVPAQAGCEHWSWSQQLFDFSFAGGSASVFCIGDLTRGTPWIYPPWQTYLNLALVLGCGYLTWHIARDWTKARGCRRTPPDS